MTDHHDFTYGQNFFADDPYSILPECSCGWFGRGVATIAAAHQAWDDHCDAIFMEATTAAPNLSEPEAVAAAAAPARKGPAGASETPAGTP